ncbi:MAG: hypothetical protein ACYDDF_03040 [Thermoplasmatota archaeon]
MRFIELGIALVVLGLILSLVLGTGGILVQIGWILVVAGVILALLHFVLGGSWGYRRGPPA